MKPPCSAPWHWLSEDFRFLVFFQVRNFYMNTFLNAILAGIALGIAGTVNLSVGGGIPGAFLFGFGLFLILCFTFKLYTGAIGYLVNQDRTSFFPYLAMLVTIWFGNFVGTFLVGMAVRQTRVAEKIVPAALKLCEVKLADTWSSVLILAIFCGLLMFIAVDMFRQEQPPLFRFAMVFLCVMVFILSGFEHCIANMYYFSVSGCVTAQPGPTFCSLLIMTFGNSLGGWFLPVLNRVR